MFFLDFVKHAAINCFWQIRVVVRRIYKLYSSVPKRPIVGKCNRSTAATWAQLTVREAAAGLTAAQALAAWWLEERRHVDVCQLVKMAEEARES